MKQCRNSYTIGEGDKENLWDDMLRRVRVWVIEVVEALPCFQFVRHVEDK